MATSTQEATKKETKNVLGLFKASHNINGLIEDLTVRGITQDDLSVIMSEGTRNNHFNQEISPEVITKLNNKAPEGFTTGTLVGGAVGALVGGLTLTGSLIIPGSQILLLGPALGAISGGAAGAASGGLIGALVGMGIPEVEAKFYQDAIEKDETVLIAVRTPKDKTEEVEATLKRYDPEKTNVSG